MPAIYISKYNKFVDSIIGRINRMLGKSYDPVRVKLQPLEDKTKKTKNTIKKTTNKKSTNKKTTTNNKTAIKKTTNKNTKKNKGKSKIKTNKRKNNLLTRNNNVGMTNKMGELSISRGNQIETSEPKLIESETREPAFVLISKTGSDDFIRNITVTTSEIRANPKRPNNKKKTNTKTKTSNKNKTKDKTKTKTKATVKKAKQSAKATLFGLSTIKRDGDVIVNMQSDHTTVKTNFILGPLTLRVEREVGKGARRELKSATATTAEMYGRLNLRIVHGGTASLHSIRVLQPKQVRVESADNHDKTREYIWKRSAHIASLVSEKLTAVARSMLGEQIQNY